ncbi:MAG: hypothetical protein AAF657_09345 [Acidobacteriota bacterium]
MTQRIVQLVALLGLGLLSSPGLAMAPSDSGSEPTVDLAAMFEGNWQMRGRFRHVPAMDWIPTRSELVAESKLGNQVILRDITAAQINFAALDLITYNPKTRAIQYIYLSNQETTALIFEGVCEGDCRHLEFEQVCGPATASACDGRTTITFESDDRFVARDYRPGPDGEPFMSREVFYTREGSETAP